MPQSKKPVRKPKKTVEETVPMPDAAWFRTRAEERGTSIAQISALVSGHKDLLNRSMNGDRVLKPDEIIGLAEALGVPLTAIFARLGYKVRPYQVPLIGTINEHARVTFIERAPGAAAQFVPAPSERSELFALQASTDNTQLAAYHGTIFYYEEAKGVRLDAIGRLAVIEIGELEAPVVGTITSNARGVGLITCLGGFETIKTAQLKSATPIIWQHCK